MLISRQTLELWISNWTSPGDVVVVYLVVGGLPVALQPVETVEGLSVVVGQGLVKATVHSVLDDEHSEMRSLSPVLSTELSVQWWLTWGRSRRTRCSVARRIRDCGGWWRESLPGGRGAPAGCPTVSCPAPPLGWPYCSTPGRRSWLALRWSLVSLTASSLDRNTGGQPVNINWLLRSIRRSSPCHSVSKNSVKGCVVLVYTKPP